MSHSASSAAALCHVYALRRVFAFVDDDDRAPVTLVCHLWHDEARWVDPTAAYLAALRVGRRDASPYFVRIEPPLAFVRELYAFSGDCICKTPRVLYAAVCRGLVVHVQDMVRHHRYERSVLDEALVYAAGHGQLAVLEWLLATASNDDDDDDDYTVRFDTQALRAALYASMTGRREHCALRLLEEPSLPVELVFLQYASTSACAAVLQAMLRVPSIDPRQIQHDLMRHAVVNGHARVVDCLIADGRLPVYQSHLQCALTNTDSCVVLRKLLRFVNPDVLALAAACERRRVASFRLLAAQPQCPSLDHVLGDAVRSDCVPIVERILSEPHVAPLVLQNALHDACRLGCNERVVDALLRDGRVDVAGDAGCDALVSACRHGHVAVVRRLLQTQHASVHMHANDDAALWWARAGGHDDVVHALLQHDAMAAQTVAAARTERVAMQ